MVTSFGIATGIAIILLSFGLRPVPLQETPRLLHQVLTPAQLSAATPPLLELPQGENQG